MAAYLDTVLRSFTGANGLRRTCGNEPSIELPWEYDYIGEPYQTQQTVRAIQDQIWTRHARRPGRGNDDLGAMSAWYVWSALGMYPMTPGTADAGAGLAAVHAARSRCRPAARCTITATARPTTPRTCSRRPGTRGLDTRLRPGRGHHRRRHA